MLDKNLAEKNKQRKIYITNYTTARGRIIPISWAVLSNIFLTGPRRLLTF